MAQVKIFGLATELNVYKKELSDIIHSCIVRAFNFPEEKRFHRFLPMEQEDFIYPGSRTSRYTIIEISIFEGRSIRAKKDLIYLLFERINNMLNIDPNDIEITIIETPKCNWGIRGKPGDELELSYKAEV